MSEPRQPNFLFFFPDQHRPDWLGSNPDLPLRTPHLDALAARGVRFTRCTCNAPLCAPSRAALASGKGYARCGVVNNQDDYPLDQPTYYQALQAAGYHVAGVGKYDLHKATLDWGLDGTRLIQEWGFHEGIDNEGKLDGSRSYLQNGRQPQGPYLATLQQRGLADAYCAEHDPAFRRPRLDAYTTCLPDDAYCDNWVAENGARLLAGFPSGRPWHLVFNFTGPHNPMDVTPSMRARWQDVAFPPPHDNDHPDREGLLRNHQNYAAMIENLDRQVGRIVEIVRQRGELEDTLIVYSSDHGEMLGEHGLWGKSRWYTPSVGVPLIVAGPGVSPSLVSDALVSVYDLAATFVDYSGAEPMPGMDARSLRPLLEGQTDAHRDVLLCGLNEWRLAYDGQYKLVTYPDRPPMLYDTLADPHEDHDVAAAHPEVIARLNEALQNE